MILLRSPNSCHNHNLSGLIPDEHIYPLMSQGEHVYDIGLLPAEAYAPKRIEAVVHQLSQPVWMSENTVGMPPRHCGEFDESYSPEWRKDAWTN